MQLGQSGISKGVECRIATSPPTPTALLIAWNEGNRDALDALLPLVFEELRRQAAGYMRRERADHTLQATALVNEAYLRLIAIEHVQWQNRAHFFAMAARLMRRILVDDARAKGYQKRGAGAPMLSLDEALIVPVQRTRDLVALDDTAEALQVSRDTVKRDWKFAKLWLHRELAVRQ